MSFVIAIGDTLDRFDGSRSISGETRAVAQLWKASLDGTASDWTPTVTAALDAIRVECSTPNWDGHGAVAISGRTREAALKLLEALYSLLPRGLPPPDVIPETDGEICISWTGDSSRTLSISIGDHGKINFAAQLGRDGGIHGWQPIDTTNRSILARSVEDLARAVGRVFAPSAVSRAAW